jgi:uncharacterized protein YciI
MLHFIIDITYTGSAEEIDAVRPLHRAFLEEGYKRGWLLCSGPKPGGAGGLVVARAPSLSELQELFAEDPYRLQNVATQTFTEFSPVMRQEFLEAWARGE